jgi:hypothetical protein
VRHLLLLVLGVLLPAQLLGQADTVPRRISFLSGGAARVALDPCTRRPPVHVDSIWQPDSATAWRLLHKLPEALRNVLPDEAGRYPGPLGQYDAAIVGFFRRGQPWLYGSFADTAHVRVEDGGVLNWCDGGWLFFGVEYWPSMDILQDPVRNAGGVLFDWTDPEASRAFVELAANIAALIDSAHALDVRVWERHDLHLGTGPGTLYHSVLELLYRAVGYDPENLEAQVRLVEAVMVVGRAQDGCLNGEYRDVAEQGLEQLRAKRADRSDSLAHRVDELEQALAALPLRCP